MTLHDTHKLRGLLRASALATALGAAALAAAAPARAFDGYGYGGCCCDDGRYNSVGFGAAGTSGGFGFGGLGAGLGGLGAGLGGGYGGGYGAGYGGGYGAGYGGGYGAGYGGGYGSGYGAGYGRGYGGPAYAGAGYLRAPSHATDRRVGDHQASGYVPRRGVTLRRYD